MSEPTGMEELKKKKKRPRATQAIHTDLHASPDTLRFRLADVTSPGEWRIHVTSTFGHVSSSSCGEGPCTYTGNERTQLPDPVWKNPLGFGVRIGSLGLGFEGSRVFLP